MKKEILNGTRIPYELSVEELSKMLSSPIMKDFSLACEALSYKNEVAAVVDVYAAFDGQSAEFVCAFSENGEMTNMDPHPNAAGHEAIAEALWDVISGLSN